MDTVVAPMQGTVAVVSVKPGDHVNAGQQLVVLESMKMEHVVAASVAGRVTSVMVSAGETVKRDQPLVSIQPGMAVAPESAPVESVSSGIRADLAEVLDRRAAGLDANRPEAVERRHSQGRRTARENVEDLCDPGTFVEYGGLVVAAQRQRRSFEELVAKTPADGMVAGVADINGSPSVVVAYDATVLAGTQGAYNHAKKDRMFELAAHRRLPVVLFAEGGGGRPGDTDIPTVAALDVPAFSLFARLSGLVPLVGVVSGRCFAGNAALLGCCDVIIATADATIGMGGPAMIEGGGLGVVAPEDVGPLSVQVPNGVVDIAVADEAEAVRVAKQYLSYFQGPADWSAVDQDKLRNAVPENRVRAYDVRAVIGLLADTGSVLELRPRFGEGIITALVRIEGRPMGLIANNPAHLGGAIDRDAADKAARFLQLCDGHGLPVVSLCDTPGFMVGPESEQTATVRHFSRLFVTGANLTVPICAIVLRKAYGLGAMAMFGGGAKVPYATVCWPTAEFGAMGLEGAVRLGFRRELEAIADPVRRKETFDRMVQLAYEKGKALNAASMFEVDDVIDPADTRRWITTALPVTVERGSRPNIDTW
ncbi:acetyl-CoA carboxylase carboxyltransferase component [Kibdelosporangium banguiense]|uniref:Acetyl-CoA carboxylase carboxyltransferase component n=1 Tax=Kibdelosporangium banguiense TaxID=1365924 RepID=A0ABS4T819_9PSEU|nr:carboxyl transferase domain-containing protein [Kibdelosporangium banguiense]MBP2320533.1 acetyl-CoA carboxylase carboxyltransferase component [Kibdelosporangium banguiense]